MIIDTDKVEKTVAILTLHGRLDTVNAPLLERKIKQIGDDISELVLDFAELEYISSMGLRVLLQTHKSMKEKKKRLVVKNMRESVREVFEMTGFVNLMVREEKFVVIRRDESGCIILSFIGEMRNENVQSVVKELTEIKEQKPQSDNQNPGDMVILDMEKLNYISPSALRTLEQSVTDITREGRKLRIRNVSGDVRAALEDDVLRKLVE